ncbi:MAG TPA: sn-glycerol-3-phosphate ABC transporter ATP-binding protein UgpC [Gemmatimonadaceae bacterium]|nr:sn-glycerol-3-phosphate ABC transporter ATP-binding protein UgpC [Gemmatimonadaceae bacterium]
MARVKLEGVRKIYTEGPQQVAVDRVDVDIHDGEFVVLVGPSGCGKSTTLRMIAGLESISAGTVSIGDRVVNDVPPKARDIAMVFQNYALYPHMSVRENLGFALKLRNMSASDIDTRVQSAAATLGLDQLLDRKPRQLSGGQRQRVALGRAIVRQPQVFLFDEPLSNLDAQMRVSMRREIARLHQELKVTMIYVTHDQVEAMTLGDRIVVMNRGHVMQIDTPINLYERPKNKFVAGFIGNPAMNFVEGAVREAGGETREAGGETREAGGGRREAGTASAAKFVADGGGMELNLPTHVADQLAPARGKAVTLGIRPEDVSVVAGPGVAPATATARLDLVESLGNETFIYARVGKHDLTARLSPPQPLPPLGSNIVLSFNLERAHFFDAASGERIG